MQAGQKAHNGMSHGLTLAAEALAEEVRLAASGRPGPNIVTGKLHGAIKAHPATTAGAGLASYVKVEGEDYFRFVESGTKNMPAYPYMSPAVKKFRAGPFHEVLVGEVRRALK